MLDAGNFLPAWGPASEDGLQGFLFGDLSFAGTMQNR